MPKLLTFFAEKPQGNFVDESDAVDRVALQAIRDAVQPTAGASHVFEPVRSLVEISDYLTAYPVDPGDHVQIIGHGRSGALELAYMWTHKYADAVDTYVVDSDPFSYKMLTAIIHPQATISIVGCLVGLGGSGSSDGPTLVYDLARLWLCAVSAPVGYIDPSDFVDGRLGDNVPQVRATPTSISIPNSTPSPPTVTDGIATLAITGLLRAPVLGDRDDGARRVAYVLGLTRTAWPAEHGGHLEFLAVRDGAVVVTERRAPGWNTLDLFDVVGTNRLHQVPIVTADVERRAIPGWFY